MRTNPSMQSVHATQVTHATHNAQASHIQKWQYLLSDTICFGKDISTGIRIQKPDANRVLPWVMKIITSGQAQSIYIENHQFDEKQTFMIQQAAQLCSVNVTLLNITQDTNNVIIGPW